MVEQMPHTTERPSIKVYSDFPTHLPVPVVRLLIATALGDNVPVGDHILYSLKTGACVIGPIEDDQTGSQFHLQKTKLRLKQAFSGELTGTARDRDTVSDIEIKEIDAKIGKIAARLKRIIPKRKS